MTMTVKQRMKQKQTEHLFPVQVSRRTHKRSANRFPLPGNQRILGGVVFLERGERKVWENQ